METKPMKTHMMPMQTPMMPMHHMMPMQMEPMNVIEEKPMPALMMPYQPQMWQQPVYHHPVVSACHPAKAKIAHVAKAAHCTSPGEILVLFILLVIISRSFLGWRG
ncbi:hypothetical protein E0485_21125 [Paenibacillus albiflavus]|uniref:Uncharacterized protein n=1 Tax=Paenibacillus albiflavus TaxID=2545760 RepID=A0A4V2WMY3_9BACL|nr:hypothetical protein [Paenibacillus albiflavus]TCZ73412.1 hypothetical protein E0485_21125 [Paenibacillus albiflavus]